jgi:hypothetical protein
MTTGLIIGVRPAANPNGNNFRISAELFLEVRSADRATEAILAKLPQLYLTAGATNSLLKRELGKSHKSWVPPVQQPTPRALSDEWPLCYSEIVCCRSIQATEA